jgi:hypothetical protein
MMRIGSTSGGAGKEAMSVAPRVVDFHAPRNVLLFEPMPGRKNFVQAVRGTKFERVAQQTEFLLHVAKLGLAPELEAGHPADFLGVIQLCRLRRRRVRRRAEPRYRIDHRFARLEGLREIFCLEGRVRDHGQCFHVSDGSASKAEFVDELQDHFFVFVSVIVA